MTAICLHTYLQQTENASYGICRLLWKKRQNKTRGLETNYPLWWKLSYKCPKRGYSPNALEMREAFKDYVNSDVGSVPWQMFQKNREIIYQIE